MLNIVKLERCNKIQSEVYVIMRWRIPLNALQLVMSLKSLASCNLMLSIDLEEGGDLEVHRPPNVCRNACGNV